MWSKVPFYLRATISLLGIGLVGLVLVLGKNILVPIAYSMLLAMLLLPMNNWLERRRIPRIGAIFISIFVSFVLILGIIYFISFQIAGFMDDMPAIKRHLADHAQTLQAWVHNTFNISGKDQSAYLKKATDSMKGQGVVGSTLLSLTDIIVLLVLIPVYTFLMLYYRAMIRSFFLDICDDKHEAKVLEVLNRSKTIVQSYMAGLLIEMAIVTGLNAIGFLIVGIQYAIFLAVLAAVLNVIPYIGMLIAHVFCMLVTLSTSQHIGDIALVALVLVLVQFIDNNFLMPKILGSKVKMNALFTILSVLIGGALCGISGMFLAIPFTAILKTILEKTDGLEAWGRLLGDEITVYEPSIIYRRLTTWRQKPKSIIPQKVELPAAGETLTQ